MDKNTKVTAVYEKIMMMFETVATLFPNLSIMKPIIIEPSISPIPKATMQNIHF